MTAMITLAAINSVPSGGFPGQAPFWRLRLFRRRGDRQNIVHARWLLEIDLHPVDDEDQAFAIPLDRQRRLLDTQEPQVIRARPLHEMQVPGVIDDAGKIGVLVVDTLQQPVSGIRQLAGKRNQSHPQPRKIILFSVQEPNGFCKHCRFVTMFSYHRRMISIPQEIGA